MNLNDKVRKNSKPNQALKKDIAGLIWDFKLGLTLKT
jgi:hypothetical protein